MPRDQREAGSPTRARAELGPPEAAATAAASRPSLALRLTRYALPAVILLAGVILAIVMPGESGTDALVELSGVCACVVLLNLLLRLGASGERDRSSEAAARAHYDEHGCWPDERRPPR